MKKTSKITIYDVAEHSGLSPKTVSRVINNSPNVSDKTRNRVQASIEYLGFIPNRMAQVLNKTQTHILGVVTLSPHYPLPIYAMSSAAEQLGYTLIVYSISPYDKKQFQKAIHTIKSQMVDGTVIISPHLDLKYQQIQDLTEGHTVVFMNTWIETDIPSINYDQSKGIELATQHLIDLGHTAICEISGPIDMLAGARNRHQAWLNVMQQTGIHNPISIRGDFTFEGGFRAVDELLRRNIEFTAIAAASDQLAVGAIRRLRNARLRVPEDVSVVGFDDAEYTAYIEPPLTTVRLDRDQLGQAAIRYLIKLIEEPNAARTNQVIVPELIVRETTRPIT